MLETIKHYDYYLIEGEKAKSLIEQYKHNWIKQKEICLELIKEVGGIAYSLGPVYNYVRPSYLYGEYCGEGVSEICWEENHDFGDIKIITKKVDGGYITAYGDGRYKTGKEFKKNN